MAYYLLAASPTFPVGTVVGAYERASELRRDGEPISDLVDTATVNAAGYAEFEGLDPNTDYWAAASVNGTWRWTRIQTEPGPERTTDPPFVQEHKRQLPVNALDFDSLQDAASAARGGTLLIPPTRAWDLDEQLVIYPGTTVSAYGAVFRPTAEDHAVKFYSPTPRTPTTTYALTGAATVGAVTVASTTGAAALVAGDRVTIRDTSYTLGGENCRRETNIVKSVAGSTVTLERPVGHAYTTSGWIAKVETANDIVWRGGTFAMSGVAGGIAADCDAIYADWPENCLVEDVTGFDHPDKVVDFHGGIDSVIRNCDAYSPSRDGAGEGYNMRVHYSRDCRIEGGWSRNVRHHADISGGQSCRIVGGTSSGRTSSSQCGAFLHGLESRWCSIDGFAAENMQVAVGAGNGSFGGDFDFSIDGTGNGCDKGVFLAQGCARGKVSGSFRNCTERGFVNDNSTDIDAAVEVYGNLSTSDASCTVSGLSSGTFKFKVRTPAYKAVTVTTTAGAGRIRLIDPDIDMGSTAQNAVEATQGVTGSEVTLGGSGRIVMADATHSAFTVNGAYDLGGVYGRIRFLGQMLRCADFDGGCKRVRAHGVVPELTNAAAEAVRVNTVGDAALADDEAVRITGNDFDCLPTGTAIRLTGPITTSGGGNGAADCSGNVFGRLTTRVTNTASARIVSRVTVLSNTTTWNPASTADGALSADATVTVTGAVVGDPVLAAFSVVLPAGCVLHARVTAADTVSVALMNESGSTQDLASGTLRVEVSKYA